MAVLLEPVPRRRAPTLRGSRIAGEEVNEKWKTRNIQKQLWIFSRLKGGRVR